MRVVYFDSREEDHKQLVAALPDFDVRVVLGSLNAETVAEAQDAEIICVFVESPITEELLAQLPQLKMIAARSAGVDHIDLAACERRGITVAHVPHYGETTVAEHTFALMLALSRKVFLADRRTERMNFDRAGLRGFDLRYKTLGVVGVGNIGKRVIEIANGFRMRVVAYDVTPDDALASELNFSYKESLAELLADSDIVSLHVPYLPKTHHLINEETIKQMKPGALLLNTARGALIDTQALLAALEEERLGGAGLDVLEGEFDTFDRIGFLSRGLHKRKDLETMLRNHLLAERPDVIITPHNAFNSREAVQRIFDTTVDNIVSFAKGSPINVVTDQKVTAA